MGRNIPYDLSGGGYTQIDAIGIIAKIHPTIIKINARSERAFIFMIRPFQGVHREVHAKEGHEY